MDTHKRWKVRILTRTMERVFTMSGTKKQVVQHLISNYPADAACTIS